MTALQSPNTVAVSVRKCMTDWFPLINGEEGGGEGDRERLLETMKCELHAFRFADYTDVLHHLRNFHPFLDRPSTFYFSRAF